MRAISISQIDKLIKHHLVREYYEGGIENMCINRFLPLCAALVFPYTRIDILNDSKSEESILPFIETIKKYVKKKKGLECYSLEGLRLFFEYNWLPTLDYITQVRLLKGVSLIVQIEDSGFFSLKGNDKVYESYLNIPVLDISNNYGDLSFDIPNEDTITDIDAEEDNDNSENGDNEASLEPLKNLLWEISPSGLKSKQYFWEYKLSTEQYNKLKEILTNLKIGNNKRLLRQKIEGYDTTIARVVALYISEWFKREYNGNDGNRDGICANLSNRIIWEKSCFPPDYLFTHEEGAGDNEWLDSIRVMGGLPIKYAINNDRFKRITQALFNIKQNDVASESDIKAICDCFDKNNKVYENSLKSENGSWRKFINRIADYLITDNQTNLPFSEKDVAEPPFSDFIKKLQEGYNEEFFKIDWCFYIEPSTCDCDCVLNLSIGYQNNNCYVTENILKRANVPDIENLKGFLLYIDYNNGEKLSKIVRFSRTAGAGSPFVGWGNSNVVHFPVVPKVGDSITIKIVDIKDVDKKNPHTLKDFTVDGYFHLFKTNNPYEWSSLTNNKAHSALIFSPIRYTLRSSDDNIEDKSIGSTLWQAHYLYDDAQLEDLRTGEIIPFKVKRGVLGIEFKMLPNTINYNKNKEIIYSYLVGDEIENESIPLLLGKDGISKVVFSPFEKGASLVKYRPGVDKDLIIKYKQEANNYKTFDDVPPHTGLLSLQVSCGAHSVVKKCFYVSNPDFVKRDLDNFLFVFNVRDAEVFQIGDEKLEYTENRDKKVFHENANYLPHFDYLTFCVGYRTVFANIKIFRARECRELYFNDCRFTEYGTPNVPLEIPFILREKFRIRTIDREGVNNVYCNHNIWMNPNVNLMSPDGDENNFKADDDGCLKYYQYVSKRTNNCEYGHYSVNPKSFYKYRFFYWNMRGNSIPIPVETEYNPQNRELVVKYKELGDSDIIFQSLKDDQPYNYVSPLLPDGSWSALINRLYPLDTILNCIEVASEHKVYYPMFYPIRRWVTKQGDLFSIFEGYCKRRTYTLKPEDYENLHRFAHEFCFEWILLSRNRWRKLYRKDELRDITKELFRRTPFVRKEKESMERVIELYFCDLDMKFRRNNRTIEGLVLECMRCINGDRSFFSGEDCATRINWLESIYRENNICYKLYQALNHRHN